MSGIIGSRFNMRGSGLVGSIGTDGQVFTSSGTGAGAVFEDAAGGGSWTFISKVTASSSGTVDFTSGLDSTYESYMFNFVNIHPETDTTRWYFAGSIDGGSNYNVSCTSSYFLCSTGESSGGELSFKEDINHHSTTGYVTIDVDHSNAADASLNGKLYLFAPSSTTFAKHWISRINAMKTTQTMENYTAGYFNTTSALNAVSFKMSAGDTDSGTVSLYGLSSS